LVRDTLERLALMVVAASDHADLEHCLDDIVPRFTWSGPEKQIFVNTTMGHTWLTENLGLRDWGRCHRG
jgi:hypothetical protein